MTDPSTAYLDSIPREFVNGRLVLWFGPIIRKTNCRSLAEFRRLVEWRLERRFPDGPKLLDAEVVQSRGE
jgi:hypothetical protein